MNQDNKDPERMEDEYDFTGGVRGKYFAQYHRVSRLVLTAGSPFVASAQTNGQGADDSTLQIVVATNRPAYQKPHVEYNLPRG